MPDIPINIVVEDELSEAVCYRILSEPNFQFCIGTIYGKRGFGYIKSRVSAFNNASKGMPYFVLADLEERCAPYQINNWLTVPKHHNLIFRVAIKEVESWLLADRIGIAKFLNIKKGHIPTNVDTINDAKQFLINLARRSQRRNMREAIVPAQDTTAKIGPGYNSLLSSFALNKWNISEALEHSDSLYRAIKALNEFQPVWTY